jgi:hypothetical protein
VSTSTLSSFSAPAALPAGAQAAGPVALTGPSFPPPAPATLHPAGSVEGALAVADLQAVQRDSARSAVNLKFQVGEDHLSVRVAMTGDQVHTQFATDSADLRGAIAREWPTLAASTGGAVHFAAPVVSGGEGSTPSGAGESQNFPSPSGQGRGGQDPRSHEGPPAHPSADREPESAPEDPKPRPTLPSGHTLEAVA